MKKLLPLLSLFILTSAFSKPLEGPTALKYFPEKRNFVKTRIIYNDLTISTNNIANIDSTIHEIRRILEAQVGRKYGHKLFSVKFGYGHSNEANIKNSTVDNGKYKAKGFFNPTFSFEKRTKDFVKDGNYVYSYGIDFTPKTARRVVNGTGANNLSPGNEVNFHVSKFTKYEDWQFLIGAFYKYFAKGDQEDKGEDKIIEVEDYAEYAIGLEFQNDLKDNFYLYAGFGFLIIEDIKTKEKSGDNVVEVQQGTGTIGRLGLKYKNGSDFYQVEVNRRKNDYFIKGKSINIEGDYSDIKFELTYIKEF